MFADASYPLVRAAAITELKQRYLHFKTQLDDTLLSDPVLVGPLVRGSV
jgi:hypothetical protein